MFCKRISGARANLIAAESDRPRTLADMAEDFETGDDEEQYSLSVSKTNRLTNIIYRLNNNPVVKNTENKKIKIGSDKFTVDKAIYSQKGRTRNEVNARIKAIPDFETIIKNSIYSHTTTEIKGITAKEAKKNVIAMHYFTTSYNGYDVEIVVRDKGEKQFLYEMKFIKNKKSPQQSMPEKTDSTAPLGDVEDNNSISQNPDLSTQNSKKDFGNSKNDGGQFDYTPSSDETAAVAENEERAEMGALETPETKAVDEVVFNMPKKAQNFIKRNKDQRRDYLRIYLSI